MEWKKGGRYVAYCECAEQVRNFPDWLPGMVDNFGKDFNPRDETLKFILNTAREDKYLEINELCKLSAYIHDVMKSKTKYVYEEDV